MILHHLCEEEHTSPTGGLANLHALSFTQSLIEIGVKEAQVLRSPSSVGNVVTGIQTVTSLVRWVW
jgi:hypothetical protein